MTNADLVHEIYESEQIIRDQSTRIAKLEVLYRDERDAHYDSQYHGDGQRTLWDADTITALEATKQP